MYKRLLKLLLSIVIIVSMLPIQSKAAVVYQDNPIYVELFTDNISGDIQVKRVKYSEPTGGYDVQEYVSFYNASKNYWGKYGSKVYYKKLNKNQKALYNRLYDICMKYLTTNINIETAKSGPYVYTNCLQFIPVNGLSQNQAKSTINIFCDANPQFYFINGSGMLFATMGDKSYVTTNFDTKYTKGSKRAKDTAIVKKKLDKWNSKIAKAKGDYKKALKIYEVVAKQLKYDRSSLSNGISLMNNQSAKTAILNGSAVCAGYAELYEMLATYAGMSCCTVTYSNNGIGHEWNQIKVGGKWYNLDITWDDTDDERVYSTHYFLKSDKTFKNLKGGSHVPEDFYDGIRPRCPKNYK